MCCGSEIWHMVGVVIAGVIGHLVLVPLEGVLALGALRGHVHAERQLGARGALQVRRPEAGRLLVLPSYHLAADDVLQVTAGRPVKAVFLDTCCSWYLLACKQLQEAEVPILVWPPRSAHLR